MRPVLPRVQVITSPRLLEPSSHEKSEEGVRGYVQRWLEDQTAMKPESTSGTSPRAEILMSESFHSGDLVNNVSEERVDGPSNLEDVKAHSTHGGADIRQSSSDDDP